MSGDGDGMPERWIEQHAGCACSRFTDFSVACGKELVSGIEHVVRRALPASTGAPTVVWIDNGDTDGSVACEAESGSEVIYLAKASCVTWTTTLLAYVHALSHVLCRMICNFLCAEDDSGQQEKDPRHGVDWRRAVDWIEAHLVGNAKYLGGEHGACIRASIMELKKMPTRIEAMLSAPAFLMEAQAKCNRYDLFLVHTAQITTMDRRQAVNRGDVRWRYQDEFEAVDTSMKPNGTVEKGSLVELALELKRDHDPDCKCNSHYTYSLLEVKCLVERLVREILPLKLPVVLQDPPRVRCIVSSKPTKSYVDKRDVFCVNVNRIETFAEAVRVVIREWARRFVVSRFDVRADVMSSGCYRRAVAGFASLLIDSFPCDGLLNKWFASEECLRLALVPAPLWIDGMVPLMRLSREGAAKVLIHRTFDEVVAHDLDKSRHDILSAREAAMHSDIEETMDMDEITDYMLARATKTTESIVSMMHTFRLESKCLGFAIDFLVSGNDTVAKIKHDAILKMTRTCKALYNPSLYDVTFDGNYLYDSEVAADIIKTCRTIKVEPILLNKKVMKGWSSAAYEPVFVTSMTSARELLEKLNVPTPESACLVVNRTHKVSGDQPFDVTGELRVFSAGYALIVAILEVDNLVIRDNIFVDEQDLHKPLEEHLSRWRLTYGIAGEVDCEGTVLNATDSLEERFNQNLSLLDDDGPLRITNRERMTKNDVTLHRIGVKDSKGKRLGTIKIRGYQAIGGGIKAFCNFVKVSPHTVQMMTTDGRTVSNNSRIYELFLDNEPLELVFTRREPPTRESRKRLRPTKVDHHGSTRTHREGKFAHPRPSDDVFFVSSDSEEEEDDA